jgi:hypothetical protein
MDFGNLQTIGGDLSVVNNTNCSLNLNQLSRVRTLSMIANAQTTLPFLSNLERAENIHLRGYIDT